MFLTVLRSIAFMVETFNSHQLDLNFPFLFFSISFLVCILSYFFVKVKAYLTKKLSFFRCC